MKTDKTIQPETRDWLRVQTNALRFQLPAWMSVFRRRQGNFFRFHAPFLFSLTTFFAAGVSGAEALPEIEPGFRDCIRDAFRKSFGIRALFFVFDAPQGAPRQSPMCDSSKPLRNPPEANRGFRIEKEKQTSEIIGKLTARNALPDNFSLVYNCEEFTKGKWTKQQQVRLLWDFKEKRASIFSLEVRSQFSSDNMFLVRKSISKKAAIKVFGSVVKDEKNFDVTIQNPRFEWRSSPDATIYAPEVIAGGALDSYIDLFYTFRGSVPFKETLEKDKNAFSIGVKKPPDVHDGGAIDVTFKKENETVTYTFDNVGVVRRQAYYRGKQKKDGSFGEPRKILFWDVKQTKDFNGFQLPLVLEGEIIMSPWLPYEETVKRRITVDEKSVRINQDLTDVAFLVKIPVGSHVSDERKGISYYSDGLDGDLEEPLAGALEAMVRKAKNNRSNK